MIDEIVISIGGGSIVSFRREINSWKDKVNTVL